MFFYQNGSDEDSSPYEEFEKTLTESQSRSMAAYWQAREAHDRRDYAQVMEYLDVALEIDPKNATALIRSSMMYSFLGEYDLAIEQLRKAQTSLREKGRYETANSLDRDAQTILGLQEENAPPLIVIEK